MNLAGYIRVSTEGQVDAYGKDVQRDSIRRWALLNGHEVIAWYEEDGVSGTKDSGDRPELSALVREAAQADVEGVVVFDATRIARRVVVQETILALIWGAELRVFTTTAGELEADDEDPTKILIRQILGVIAEFDHRNTVKKLHAARKIKSSKGGYIGGTPRYGLTVVGNGMSAQFVENAVESEVIERIQRLHACGYSLRTIAKNLNDSNIETKMGKMWNSTQVQRIIQRSNNSV